MLNIFRINVCKTPIIHRHCGSTRPITSGQSKEYYNLLKVTKSSTAKEIKDSFLRLSKVYHPDNKETGSHVKFVALKQAYDAIKDGPPAVEQPSYTYTGYPDLRYRRPFNSRPFDDKDQQFSSKFGGPFRDSRNPWEDFKRNQEYRQSYSSGGRYRAGQGLVQTTVWMGVTAWIVIYSCILYAIDFDKFAESRLRYYNGKSKRGADEYEEYRDIIRERRLAKQRALERKEEAQSTPPDPNLADLAPNIETYQSA